MKNFMIVVLALLALTFVGCKNNNPTATVFNPTLVGTSTATATPTSTDVIVATATATATATVNLNTHSYYVTITGTQAGNVDACVSKRLIGQTVTWVRQTYYMDATYSYVWTSTVISVDNLTEVFHTDGICLDQAVHIVVYKDGAIRTQWDQPANNVFAYND